MRGLRASPSWTEGSLFSTGLLPRAPQRRRVRRALGVPCSWPEAARRRRRSSSPRIRWWTPPHSQQQPTRRRLRSNGTTWGWAQPSSGIVIIGVSRLAVGTPSPGKRPQAEPPLPPLKRSRTRARRAAAAPAAAAAVAQAAGTLTITTREEEEEAPL